MASDALVRITPVRAEQCGFNVKISRWLAGAEMRRGLAVILVWACSSSSLLACDVKVEAAWIRTPPPGVSAAAGYARLANRGLQTLRIQHLESKDFAAIEAHESFNENGMAKMRSLNVLEIPAGSTMEFMPSGKHFMLMNPKRPLNRGDLVSVTLRDAKGCATAVTFTVRDAAPDGTVDHSTQDHLNMDHSAMGHGDQ